MSTLLLPIEEKRPYVEMRAGLKFREEQREDHVWLLSEFCRIQIEDRNVEEEVSTLRSFSLEEP
jgi:hypothetical protein